MSTYAEVTHPRTPAPFPSDWLQGRGAFGGAQAGRMLRAVQELAPERPVRSVSVSFVGPTGTEACSLEPRIIRSGRSVTHASCELAGSDGVAASALIALGSDRESSVKRPPRTATVPTARGVSMPFIEGIMPNFVQYFDLAFTSGLPPFSGVEGELVHAGWCSHKTDPGPSASALLGLLDAWPSPALQGLKGLAPASTVTWSAQLLNIPATVTIDDRFYFECKVLHAPGNGFVTMRGELYNESGVLMAHLEQLVALFG